MEDLDLLWVHGHEVLDQERILVCDIQYQLLKLILTYVFVGFGHILLSFFYYDLFFCGHSLLPGGCVLLIIIIFTWLFWGPWNGSYSSFVLLFLHHSIYEKQACINQGIYHLTHLISNHDKAAFQRRELAIQFCHQCILARDDLKVVKTWVIDI